MSRRDNLDYYMQQVLRRKRENVQRYERELSLLSPEAKLRQVRERTARLTDRLYDSMSLKIKDKRNRLVLLASKLEGGSPLKKLESGFAYMADEEGKRVKSVKQVKKGSHINLSLTDGYIAATVDSIEEK